MTPTGQTESSVRRPRPHCAASSVTTACRSTGSAGQPPCGRCASNGTSSTLGEALAEFIQRELTARTGMLDCGTHPKTWELLRMTRMPAVRVELGYLTNPQDRRKLLDPAFRDVVAEGIVVAVKRLYLLGENDQPTGTFTFADLLRSEVAQPAL